MQFANWELFVSKLAEMPSRIWVWKCCHIFTKCSGQVSQTDCSSTRHEHWLGFWFNLYSYAIYDGVFVIWPSWTNFWIYFPLMVTLLTTEGPQWQLPFLLRCMFFQDIDFSIFNAWHLSCIRVKTALW